MPELVPAAAAVHPKPSAAHPNIVFVLTDDLSSDLVEYMPHVRALEQRGMTFTNYTVTDSLCCPSRASKFTGEFPDRQRWLSGHLPSYTAGFTYVVYANGEREFYDRTTDPWERHNTYAQLSAARVATLNRVVRALTSCRGYAQCWQSSVPAERAS